MTESEREERDEQLQRRIERAAARVRGEEPPLLPPARIVRSLSTGRVSVSRGAFS